MSFFPPAGCPNTMNGLPPNGRTLGSIAPSPSMISADSALLDSGFGGSFVSSTGRGSFGGSSISGGSSQSGGSGGILPPTPSNKTFVHHPHHVMGDGNSPSHHSYQYPYHPPSHHPPPSPHHYPPSPHQYNPPPPDVTATTHHHHFIPPSPNHNSVRRTPPPATPPNPLPPPHYMGSSPHSMGSRGSIASQDYSNRSLSQDCSETLTQQMASQLKLQSALNNNSKVVDAIDLLQPLHRPSTGG